jgi:hypothetical protein
MASGLLRVAQAGAAAAAIAMAAALAGCVAPAEQSAVFTSAVPARAVAQQISAAARRCWGRGQANFTDAVIIEDGAAGSSLLVTGRRAGTGIRPQDPFIRVAVSEQGTGSRIEVAEGDFTINTRLDLTSDVRRWVSGDQACR